MYFSDLAYVVQANKAPNAYPRFHKTRFGPVELATIIDYTLPVRANRVNTGWAEDDWYQSSLVTNVMLNEMPFEDRDGVWVEQVNIGNDSFIPAHWDRKPCIGYYTVLKRLLNEGCLVPSHELDVLMRCNSRRHAHYGRRILYIP